MNAALKGRKLYCLGGVINKSKFFFKTNLISSKYIPLVFIFFALPLTVGYVFVIYPLQGNDEWGHFLRSVDITYGNVSGVPGEGDNIGYPTVEIPSSMVGFITSSAVNINNYKEYSSPLSLSKADIKDLRWSTQTTRVSDIFGVYPPISYTFSTIGTLIGKVLDLKVSTTILLGRITNSILSLICFVVSLLLIRRSKLYLFFILSLPSCLSIISSFSQDAFLISVSALTVALMTTLDRNSSSIRLLLVTLGFSIIILVRPHYFPLMIFLMIYLLSLGFKKNYVILIGVLSVLPSVVWYYSFSDLMIRNMFPGVDEIKQINYIKSEPLKFIKAAYYSVRDEWGTIFFPYVSNKAIFHQFIASMLGGVSVVFFTIGLFTLYDLKKKLIFMLLILACFFSFFLITLTAYISWTKYQDVVVNGMQGRYILPMLIMMAFPDYSFKNLIFKKMHYSTCVVTLIFISVVVNFLSLIQISEYFIYR